MKKVWFSILLLHAVLVGVSAQFESHINWNFSLKPLEDKKVEIICTAMLDEGWHVYSSVLPENTAEATDIVIEKNDNYVVKETVIEHGIPKKHFDESFDAELAWFDGSATFSKIVQLNTDDEVIIKGYVYSMVCNDETCMPPEEVEFALNSVTGKSVAIEESGASNAFSFGTASTKSTVDVQVAEEKVEEIAEPVEAGREESYWGLFLLAFIAGFAALLTPCVFPMIPMTVSFFIKQSPSRSKGIKNAMLFGVSIILIYVLLGTIVTAIFGADFLNSLSTNPWFNTFFFLLLVVFAISFFGAFEIIMPSSWVNFADKNSDKGGIIGIFFMAFTLALVSFSCTGPLVGTILFQSATGGFIGPIIGMLGFSLALALPFTLFAAFPGYLNSLPKSGGWLNSVKVVLGFLELAFAFKFLSIADMVMDLHLLEREVFIAIWIVIFAAMGFYLLGKIKLPHDSKMEYIPVSRFLIGLLTLAFAVYMIPGLWGAPVNLISGFPPPKDYAESPFGVGSELPSAGGGISQGTLPEGMHFGPQGIPAFDDYDKALNYAKEIKKPILLDFTGKGCTNCRKMEDKVWSNKQIKELLTNDYILVSLYVDLRTELEEPYVSELTGKKIRTIGQKWSEFQFVNFQQQGQPYYVLIDENGEKLNEPKAYDPDIKSYKAWLDEGLKAYAIKK